MRAALFALLALGAMSAIDVTPAAAASGPYPYCQRTRFDEDDCSYRSFADCMAAASGLGQSCFNNPAAVYYERRPAPTRYKHKRKHRHSH